MAVSRLVKPVTVCAFFVLCFCHELVAQSSATQDTDKQVAVKVLEIGKASRQAFKRQLQVFWESYAGSNVPLYIINYGSDTEIANREKVIVDGISFREFDRSRITLVRGGGTIAKTVIWKVPYGADNPVP